VRVEKKKRKKKQIGGTLIEGEEKKVRRGRVLYQTTES
jgi:hypothetical protein